MDAVLHVPNWQEHGALLSVCQADKTCSQLPSAFTLRIYKYRYGHKAGVQKPLPLATVCQPLTPCL